MKRRQTPLYLHEEIMLLALRDEEGTVAAEHTYRFALGGAVIAELLLAKRVAVDQGQGNRAASGLGRWLKDTFTEKELVDPISVRPLGDSLLDEYLQRISVKILFNKRDLRRRRKRIERITNGQLLGKATKEAIEAAQAAVVVAAVVPCIAATAACN